MNLSAQTTPRLSPQVVSHTIEDTVALLDTNSGVYYTVDGPGIILVEMCDGEATLEQVAQQVCEEYEVGEDEALADLIELTEALAEEGLVLVDGD